MHDMSSVFAGGGDDRPFFDSPGCNKELLVLLPCIAYTINDQDCPSGTGNYRMAQLELKT